MGNAIKTLFSFLSDTFVGIKDNMDELKIESEIGLNDLDEVLKNPKDRIIFEEELEKLKNGKEKTAKVKFSDRELQISID